MSCFTGLEGDIETMASNHGGKDVMDSGSSEGNTSEATVEIKIKTLDSQTYTLRVDKRVNTILFLCFCSFKVAALFLFSYFVYVVIGTCSCTKGADCFCYWCII